MDGEDLGESVLIYLDVESLNPAISQHQKQDKPQFSTTRKCYSHLKKKVQFIAYIYMCVCVYIHTHTHTLMILRGAVIY